MAVRSQSVNLAQVVRAYAIDPQQLDDVSKLHFVISKQDVATGGIDDVTGLPPTSERRRSYHVVPKPCMKTLTSSATWHSVLTHTEARHRRRRALR